MEAIFQGGSNLLALIRDYEDSLNHLEQNPSDEHLQKNVLALQHRMDSENAWEIENQIKIK